MRIPLYRNGFYEIEIIATPIDNVYFGKKITDSFELSQFIFSQVNWEKLRLKEHFWVIGLDRSNKVHTFEMIGIGCDAGVRVDLRAILRLALVSFSAGVIICHNHPSGNMKPSGEDTRLTKQVKEGLRSLNLTFIDHIIIGEDPVTQSKVFYSFADEGLL